MFFVNTSVNNLLWITYCEYPPVNNLLCLPDKVNFEEKFSLLFSDHVLATGFTTCDKTCGGGIRLRMIKVNNRQVLQRRSCNVQNCPGKGAAIFLRL